MSGAIGRELSDLGLLVAIAAERREFSQSCRIGCWRPWRRSERDGCHQARIEVTFGTPLSRTSSGEWASGAYQPVKTGVSGRPSPNPACTFRYAPGSPSMFTRTSDRGRPLAGSARHARTSTAWEPHRRRANAAYAAGVDASRTASSAPASRMGRHRSPYRGAMGPEVRDRPWTLTRGGRQTAGREQPSLTIRVNFPQNDPNWRRFGRLRTGRLSAGTLESSLLSAGY